MTELILIRHGQANSSGDNYDELTETGLEQAEKIGQWLAHSGEKFDTFIHGGLKRQQQTLDAIRHELGDSSAPNEIHPAFAEFDLKVFGILAADMRHGRPDFAETLSDWNRARKSDAPDKGNAFKKMMALVLAEWVRRGDTFTEAESFPAFQKKVLGALEIGSTSLPKRETEDGRTTGPVKKPGRYLAVTSGGPISMLTGHVLGLSVTQTLGLMRRIYNTSLHHFVLQDGKWELASFNTVPHLRHEERTLV